MIQDIIELLFLLLVLLIGPSWLIARFIVSRHVRRLAPWPRILLLLPACVVAHLVLFFLLANPAYQYLDSLGGPSVPSWTLVAALMLVTWLCIAVAWVAAWSFLADVWPQGTFLIALPGVAWTAFAWASSTWLATCVTDRTPYDLCFYIDL